MKTIIGKRCSGKTTALLQQISMDGYSHPVIVVPNAEQASFMSKMIRSLNVHFRYEPQVMTFKEYICYCTGKSEITSYGNALTFYFDNLERCLQVNAPMVTVCAMDDDRYTYEDIHVFNYTLAKPLSTHPNIRSSIGGMTINSDGYDTSVLLDRKELEYSYRDQKAIMEFFKSALSLPDNKPHIDHVKFNGPATIVFWKDGTKTVVKFDKKGIRNKKLAVLYAFIRKIYGEGRNYHDILEEIEKACK